MDAQNFIPRLRSPLFLIATTAVILLLLTHLINEQQQQKLIDLRTSHYGKALASMAANQAANATLNSDLISLQVTLENIIENPHILSTTIYDVENQLLVQAGDSPKLGRYSNDNSKTYTATITLNDSVAGYVAVTIDTQAIWEQQDSAWFIGLLAVAIMLGIFSLMSDPPPANKTNGKTSNADSKEPNPVSTSPNEVQVTLLLHTLNIDALRKQISGSLRDNLFDELGKKIDGINMLYNGKIEDATENWLTIQFGGSDISDASFRAACAALLFFQLLEESSTTLKLKFCGAIYHLDKNPRLSKLLQAAKHVKQCQEILEDTPAKQLRLHNESCNNHDLAQRLVIEGDSDWPVITQLQSGYGELLNKQASQLKEMLKES